MRVRFFLGVSVAALLIGAGCTGEPSPTFAPEGDSAITTSSTSLSPEDVGTGEVPASPGSTAPVPVAVSPLAVTMQAVNFGFTPTTMTASPGQEIAITFSGVSGMHTFVIDELNIATSIAEGKTFTFSAPLTPGTYAYYCGTGSHRALGMEGTLTVR